jgi:hypothetical protein
MKLIFIFSIILITVGCFKKNDKSTANPIPPVAPIQTEEPQPVEDQVEEQDVKFFKMCDLIDTSACDISDHTAMKLALISMQGQVISTMLDFESVKNKYHLSSQQVQCLKDNYCKEEF